MISDAELHAQIEQLVSEEHELERRGGANAGLNEIEHARLAHVKLQLDQAWDLLRQRRARLEAGLDPDYSSLRDVSTVEGYEQ